MDRLRRPALLAGIALFLCLEWGPLNAERARWGIASGDPFVREIALTFDDGPREHGMQELMAAMAPFGVHGTFFLVGKFADRYAGITLALQEAGHDLENHSFTHPKLYTLWVEKIMRETERCNEVIEGLGIRKPRFMRPPGGSYNLKILNAMRRMDMRLGLWNINSADYTGKSAGEIAAFVLRRASPGAIVLMHSGVPATVEALPEILRELGKRGYRFVSVQDLWNCGAI